jgi:hypothetical protein
MLTSTNATIYDSISSTEDVLSKEDSDMFQTVIQENEQAILAQKERIEMCIYVLKKRLGIDPTNKHYDLDPNTTAITARDVTPQLSTQSGETQAPQGQNVQTRSSRESDTHTEQEAEEEEGGMYL